MTSPNGRPARPSTRFGARERELCFSVAMKYMRDATAADDVAQDAMLRAFRYRDRFRGEARYSTWLYRVAASTALMHLRKEQRLRRRFEQPDDIDALDPLPGESSTTTNPESHLIARQSLQLLLGRLQKLASTYQRVFWPYFFEDKTEAETAAQLALSGAAVKSRIHRLRAAMRASLQAELADCPR